MVSLFYLRCEKCLVKRRKKKNKQLVTLKNVSSSKASRWSNSDLLNWEKDLWWNIPGAIGQMIEIKIEFHH